MFSAVPERRMRATRTILLVMWLVLIGSLFLDPWTSALTRPDNLSSPFRIEVSKQVLVQGKPLPAEPYPIGARVFWTMLIPIVPMFLMLFGHEAWRRICPLSLSTQLAQYAGLQNRTRVFNRRSGRVERKLRLIRSASPVARYLWFIQFGLLWLGVTGRLLFMNSDRTFLACFLLGVIGIAASVGFFFGGKTWCNYFCPISTVQKIYTGPGGLLESKAYRAKGVSQSTCRNNSAAGDQSTCVGCVASCPDTDLERSYWDNLFKPGKRFATYGYLGMVVGFYAYYRLYSGNWDYYFSGAWTHEPGQLAALASPGFYFGGAPIDIPKFLAAPLTTGGFVLLAFGLGVLLERTYGRLRDLFGNPLAAERLRHQSLTLSAFATFNAFYLFGGRPNLNLLPPGILKAVDVLIVVVSTLWLGRALRAGSAVYRRESLAQSMLRQLQRLKMSFSAILEGRSLEELNADEIYMLSKTLSSLPDDKRETLYRNVLWDALTRGEISGESSLEAMREIRQQMNVDDHDHERIMSELSRLDPGIASASADDPGRLRLSNYRSALENVVRRCLESGRAVREEMKTPRNAREVEKLREIFDVSDAEHDETLSELLDRSPLVLREARGLLEELAETTLRIEALNRDVGSSRVEGLELLAHHLERRRRDLGLRVARLLTADTGGSAAVTLARWLNVILRGRGLDLLGAAAANVTDPPTGPIPGSVLEVLREDVARSAAVVDEDPTVEFAALRSLLRSRPQPGEFLAEIACGPEPAPAAVALSVLGQVDRERGRSVAEAALARSERHWLVEEVARAVVAPAGKPAEQKPTAPREPAERHYRAEAVGTVSRMGDLFRSHFFHHLGLGTLASIARAAETRVYRRGGVLCRTGESSDRVFVICGGTADVFIEREGGNVWTNAVGVGDSIGELGVLTQRPRSATVIVSRDESRVISIEGDQLISVLRRDTGVAMSFLQLLSARQQGMLAKMSGEAPA